MEYLAFEGMIHQYSIEHLLEELRRTNAPRNVYVSSPGGSFEFFSVLGPAIEQRGIVTLSGDVRSAAIILYLLGHRRQALPDATFFFHEVRTLVGGQGNITIADLEEVEEYQEYLSHEHREYIDEWMSQMKAAQAWFLHFLREKTGIPTGTFLNLMRNEATLTAKDAVRYGIVHEIISANTLR